MNKISRCTLLIITLIGLFSCTPQKKLIYLKNAETGIHETGQQFIYTIRPGDILAVNVFSVNEKASEMFRFPSSASGGGLQQMGAAMHGFTVSDSGNVKLPTVGEVKMLGLTLEQAGALLEVKIREIFPDAVVDVKLLNFKITILGEVNRPGVFEINEPRVNILQAIAMAGDLNIFGKRDVTLIRETSKGYELFKVDLQDKSLMSREYFYLLPNDIIYVEPHKAKSFGANTVPTAISAVMTVITTVILIINIAQ